MIPLLLAAALAAAPAPTSGRAAECLRTTPGNQPQYIGVDDHTIVVRSSSRAWKLTTTPSSLVNDPSAIFVNVIRGPSTLCSRLDFQLSVATQPPGSIQVPLIVQDFQSITLAEADALTKRNKRGR